MSHVPGRSSLTRIVVFGGTELTLAVAERALELQLELAALAYVGDQFEISYAPHGVENSRAVDIEAWCTDHGVAAHRYRGTDALAEMANAAEAELGLAVGWYHMIPRRVRSAFRRGCVGLHASLLPRFRGGAPLNWALLAGETETGVTLFELGDGVDDGPVYGSRSFAVASDATIRELVEDCERASLQLITDHLPAIVDGSVRPTPQAGPATYSLQRAPEDGQIDWNRPAADIERLVRAVTRPYPGARTSLDGSQIFIWAAEASRIPIVYGAPGQIALVPEIGFPCVVTGEGLLVIRDATDGSGASVMDDLRRAVHRRLVS